MFNLLCVLLAFSANVSAFTVLPKTQTLAATSPLSMNADNWASSSATGEGSGQLERIEFKIYPDGRVEEIVRGVKGANCHKITEDINKALGVVISTTPTEEMFEEEIVVNQKITQSDWEGSSSW